LLKFFTDQHIAPGLMELKEAVCIIQYGVFEE